LRPSEHQLALRLTNHLEQHSRRVRSLPGIADLDHRNAFVEQLVESIRRVRYVRVVRNRPLSLARLDPDTSMFDPLKGAILAQRAGAIDEAFWLVFLFVHFGKHRRAGWSYARHVYGRLGSADGLHWNWTRTSADPAAFRRWLHSHQGQLQSMPGGFGNHRKYESLDAYSPRGTGAVVESYIEWVTPPRTHLDVVRQALDQAGPGINPNAAFHFLYESMAAVKRFGRTARFDYLCMVSKLRLAQIQPGSAYLQNATGPVAGARLLFGGSKKAGLRVGDLDRWLVDLDQDLDVGMQVLEDSLCNWQKSPNSFRPFRG